MLWTLVWKTYLNVAMASSGLTFLVYGWDKLMARTGGFRVSERFLHSLEVLGGWPGALLAQKCFRHKTRKSNFEDTFRMAIELHLVSFLLCWMVLS